MKRLFLSLTAVGLLAGVTLAPLPAVAASAAIEQAKNSCTVGEQADGYLGFVTGKTGSTALKREVRGINQQRKAVYADLAKKNGVSINVTAALTAEKLMNQATRGQCVRMKNGSWVEK